MLFTKTMETPSFCGWGGVFDIQRSAYRIYSQNPNASEEQFRSELGREYFEGRVDTQSIDDLLAIQEISALERTWYQPSPVVSIDRCRALKAAADSFSWGTLSTF